MEITRSQFAKGYAIYAFSLAPSDLGEEFLNLVKQENVRLEVKFAVSTVETLNCLAYAEFPALLEVDQSRDILYTKVNLRYPVCHQGSLPTFQDGQRSIFTGYPALESDTYPSAFVCYTDPSHLPGQHRVVVWKETLRKAEFFDSLGQCPEHCDDRIKDFLIRNSEKFIDAMRYVCRREIAPLVDIMS